LPKGYIINLRRTETKRFFKKLIVSGTAIVVVKRLRQSHCFSFSLYDNNVFLFIPIYENEDCVAECDPHTHELTYSVLHTACSQAVMELAFLGFWPKEFVSFFSLAGDDL